MADDRPKPFKIALCVPNEGTTLWEASDSQFLFAMHLGKLQALNPEKYEFYFGTVGRVVTFVSRNRLTEFALDLDADFMLQWDNDMILPVDMFERLFKTMEEEKADIVAPLAFMRNPPHHPVIFSERTGYDGVAHKPYSQHDIVHDYPAAGVLEVDAVGFGAALIRMSMVKKMNGRHWFMSTTACGEDVWFCKRARAEAHAKVVVDTRIMLGHLGAPLMVTEKTYKDFRKKQENPLPLAGNS